ncbi:MAG: leucine-rich repeat domain-containing protein [Bacteroidaceae bacterium]|nr:leucine-rich repeat domain-containing protein [Bacteroidaceae bacterium]
MQRLLLMVVGLACAAQVSAYDFKAENEDGVTIYYNIDGTNAIVTSGDGEYVGDVKIPATVVAGGITYRVTTIGSKAFYNCQSLTSIEIPSSVTSIGSNAFYSCRKLNEVISHIITPFKIESSVFSYVHNNAILYVPAGTKESYESTNGWKGNFSNIVESLEVIEFASSSMRTFCSEYALDFSNVNNLKAYIASGFSVETGDVIMLRVDKVPARTGLLIVGRPNMSYEVPFAETDFIYSNLFVGVTEDTDITSGYVFIPEGSLFEAVNESQTVNAGEAYLNIPSGAKKQLSIRLTDTTTGVEDLKMEADDEIGWYSLQGTRLADKPAQPGIYLHGGKKVLVK